MATGGCYQGEGKTAPRRHVVEISGFGYEPASVEVAPGDTIVWVNRDVVPHTATAVDGGWDTGSIAAGESWSGVLPVGAESVYTCAFHPGMKARIRLTG
jgi:plastocyanin